MDTVDSAQLSGGWRVVAVWVIPGLALAVLPIFAVTWGRTLKRTMRKHEVAMLLYRSQTSE